MTKFGAVLKHKCPRCHEGDLFETRISSLQRVFHMPLKCPKCGLNYYPEPGFYYGAMFISYIITAFYCLGFAAICLFVFDLSVNATFLWLFASLVIFYVWFYRTSRSVWIHVNVKYDPNAGTAGTTGAAGTNGNASPRP